MSAVKTSVPFESTHLGKALAIDGEKTLVIVMRNMGVYDRCKSIQGLLDEYLKTSEEDAVVSRYLGYVGSCLEDIAHAAPEYRQGTSTELPTYPTMARISLEIMQHHSLPAARYKRLWKRLADAIADHWATVEDEDRADRLIKDLLEAAKNAELDNATLANSLRQSICVPITRLLRHRSLLEGFVLPDDASGASGLAQSLIKAVTHLYVTLASEEELSSLLKLASAMRGTSPDAREAVLMEAKRWANAQELTNGINYRLSIHVKGTALQSCGLQTSLIIDPMNNHPAVRVIFENYGEPLPLEDIRAETQRLLEGNCIPTADYPMSIMVSIEQGGRLHYLTGRSRQ